MKSGNAFVRKGAGVSRVCLRISCCQLRENREVKLIMQRVNFILGTALMLFLVACSPNSNVDLTFQPEPDMDLQASPTPSPIHTQDVGSTPNFDELRSVLAEELGESIDRIIIKSVQEMQFRNSCLGLEKPGEMCMQVITPGFRVNLETPQGSYVFHTDQSGARFRMAQSPEGLQSQAAMVWERSGGIAGICQQLVIYSSGAYVMEDCNNQQTIGKGRIPPSEWENLQSLLDQYDVFQWEFEPPEGSADMFIDRYTLNGNGESIPSEKVQESINETLAELAVQLDKMKDPGAVDK